jgi:hypothetical protein
LKMRVSTKSFALLAVAVAVSSGDCFQKASAWTPSSGVSTTKNFRKSGARSNLFVASQDLEETVEATTRIDNQEQQSAEHVPYVVARGDGSKGGGGVPMPRASEEEEDNAGLRRPKVNAEMPEG